MQDWTPRGRGRRSASCRTILRAARQRQGRRLTVLTGLTADKARPNGDGPGDHARAMAAFLTGCQPRKTDGADIRAGVSVDQVAAARVGRPDAPARRSRSAASPAPWPATATPAIAASTPPPSPGASRDHAGAQAGGVTCNPPCETSSDVIGCAQRRCGVSRVDHGHDGVGDLPPDRKNGSPARMSRRTASIDLPPIPTSVPTSRHLVLELLRVWDVPHDREDAALLVTELVVQRGRPRRRRGGPHAGAVGVRRVAAHRASSTAPRSGPSSRSCPRPSPWPRDADGPGDRGPVGRRRPPGGKRVWFELRPPPPADVGRARGLPPPLTGDGLGRRHQRREETAR